jgi:hypothetical protein
MSDTKRHYTTDGIEIRTFQPQLPPGGVKPDPTKPPPFASTKPQPAGQWPRPNASSGGRKK